MLSEDGYKEREQNQNELTAAATIFALIKFIDPILKICKQSFEKS